MKKLMFILIPILFVSCVYSPCDPEKDRNVRSKTTYEDFTSVNQPIGIRRQYTTDFGLGSGKKHDHTVASGYLYFVYDWENNKIATYTYSKGTIAESADNIMASYTDESGVTKLYSSESYLDRLTVMQSDKSALESEYFENTGDWTNTSRSNGRYAIMADTCVFPMEKGEDYPKNGTVFRCLDGNTGKLSDPVRLYGRLEYNPLKMTDVDEANESWFIYLPYDSENYSEKRLGKYDVTTNQITEAGTLDLTSLFQNNSDTDDYFSYYLGFSNKDSVYVICTKLHCEGISENGKGGKETRSSVIAQIDKKSLKVTNSILFDGNVDLRNLFVINNKLIAVGETADDDVYYQSFYEINMTDSSAKKFNSKINLLAGYRIVIRDSRIYFIHSYDYQDGIEILYFDTEKDFLSEETKISVSSIIE